LRLAPYKPEKEDCDIKLDANENPYEIPNDIKSSIWKRFNNEKFNYYCDPSCDELRMELSKYTGLDPEGIFVGSGADEIISDLIFAFAGPGRDVIIPSPAFSSYEIYTRVSGANVIKVPLKLEQKGQDLVWDLDVPAVKKHFRHDLPQLMFLCYPNNPTGDYFDENKILELIDSFYGIVAIDEAYYEFGGKTFTKRLFKYPNVVIIRTFSKLFSLAGLRVGYALGHYEAIEQLYKVKLPYNVTLFSQIAAVEVLRNMKWVSDVREKLIKSREELKNELVTIHGLMVYPSCTNFFLCELKAPRDKVYFKLLEKGILTRRLSGDGLDNTLRFSVGTKKQNKALVSALRQIMSDEQ
jgi:histidinol-phosphate aminotransferase